jgi:hypothetical protein
MWQQSEEEALDREGERASKRERARERAREREREREDLEKRRGMTLSKSI